MAKKAVIVVTLVDESEEKTNDELEKEIFYELSKAPTGYSLDEAAREGADCRGLMLVFEKDVRH